MIPSSQSPSPLPSFKAKSDNKVEFSRDSVERYLNDAIDRIVKFDASALDKRENQNNLDSILRDLIFTCQEQQALIEKLLKKV